MLRWCVFLISLRLVLTIKIGQLSHGTYVPQVGGVYNASYTLLFTTSCTECLCYAFSSNINFVAINCFNNTQQCLFYTNFSTSYSFQLNINATVYFLQPLPVYTTQAPTTSTMSATTMTTTTTITPPTCSTGGRGTLASFNGAPLVWTSYRYNYTATKTVHTLMFGFTSDGTGQRFWFLDDVSVVDVISPSIQLLQNPSFDNSTSALTGWTQWCTSSCPSTGNAGKVTSGSNCSSTNCYIDHCYGSGVDFLGQTFATIVGHIYTISFRILDYGSGANGATKAYIDIY